jgi:hypothetical protein
MLRKVAAALIAVTMFTAPVLAQSTAPVRSEPAGQTAKVKPVKVVKVKKHVTKHKVKKAKVAAHRKHIRHVRHGKPAKAVVAPSTQTAGKPVMAPARSN